MGREKEILKHIEDLRQQLELLVRNKGSTTDTEVLIASQRLDVVLNEYYRFLKAKTE